MFNKNLNVCKKTFFVINNSTEKRLYIQTYIKITYN